MKKESNIFLYIIVLGILITVVNYHGISSTNLSGNFYLGSGDHATQKSSIERDKLVLTHDQKRSQNTLHITGFSWTHHTPTSEAHDTITTKKFYHDEATSATSEQPLRHSLPLSPGWPPVHSAEQSATWE